MGNLIIEIPPIGERDCYYIQERYKPCFNYPLHKHNVYEFNFVEHCEGARRIVGDSVEVLGEYDLAFVGCNLEHVWEQYECKPGIIHELTIMSPADFFEAKFMEKNCMKPVKDMFENAQVGVAFGMRAIMTVYDRINQIVSSEPSFGTVQTLLSIIYDLAASGDYHTLASSHYSHAEVPVTSRRIKKLKDYIDAHFNEEIRIEVLADMVGMTPNALSRFFKQRTNRSISNYINEVRLGHATNMLADSTMSIAEISYRCGFNTISNFNRIFKNIKEITPKEFRESYKKNIFFI